MPSQNSGFKCSSSLPIYIYKKVSYETMNYESYENIGKYSVMSLFCRISLQTQCARVSAGFCVDLFPLVENVLRSHYEE